MKEVSAMPLDPRKAKDGPSVRASGGDGLSGSGVKGASRRDFTDSTVIR